MEGKTNEELVELHKAGDQQAIVELWENNHSFIWHMARKLSAYAEAEDLLQEAFFGLRSAADLYDPEKDVQFLTYAGYWIRQSMGRYIENCGTTIRMAAGTGAKLLRMKRSEEQFFHMAGREPNDRELCAMLQITPAQLQDLKQAAKLKQCRSLAELLPGDDELTLGDAIPDERNLEEDVIEKIDRERLASTLDEVLQKLPEDQRAVIHAKYWEGVKDFTLDEKNALRRAKKSLQRAHVRSKLEPYFDACHFIPHHVGVGYFQNTGMSEQLIAVIRAEEARKHFLRQCEREIWDE